MLDSHWSRDENCAHPAIFNFDRLLAKQTRAKTYYAVIFQRRKKAKQRLSGEYVRSLDKDIVRSIQYNRNRNTIVVYQLVMDLYGIRGLTPFRVKALHSFTLCITKVLCSKRYSPQIPYFGRTPLTFQYQSIRISTLRITFISLVLA